MSFFNKNRLTQWLSLAIFLTTMAGLSGSTEILKCFILFFLASAVIAIAGELCIMAGNLGAKTCWLPSTMVAGVISVSLAMFPLTYLLHFSAPQAFFLISPLIIFIAWQKKDRLSDLSFISTNDRIIYLLLILIIGFAVKIPASSMPVLHSEGILPIWNDYYLHAMTLNSFGHAFSIGHGNPILADTPMGFYHYAPFMTGAASMFVTGLSGLATATAILLPTGLLVGIFGIYSLATALGGRLAGALSIALLICLPTPVSLSQNGFFDFYWLLFISPGSGYAIGLSTITLIAFIHYLKTRNTTTAIFTAIACLSIIFVRAHMFLIIAPTLCMALLFDRLPNHRKWIFGLGILFAFFITILLITSETINTFWTTTTHIHDYMSFTLASNSYYQTIAALISSHIHHGLLAAQIFLILFAALGIFLIVFPASYTIYAIRLKQTITDWIPWFVVVSFILLTLFAPIAHNGDASEYRHRHFVLAYPLIIIFSSYFILAAFFKKRTIEEKSVLQLSLVVFSLLYVIVSCWNYNPASPKLALIPWANNLHNQKLASGTIDASAYLNSQSAPGDIFATNSQAAYPSLTGTVIEISALSGLPTFISRTELPPPKAPELLQIYSERLQIMKDIESANDWPTVRDILIKNHIRWYVAIDNENPKFDIENRQRARRFGTITIYDAKLGNPQ